MQLYLSGSTDLEPGKSSLSTLNLPDVSPFTELRLWLRDNGSGVHSQVYVSSVSRAACAIKIDRYQLYYR